MKMEQGHEEWIGGLPGRVGKDRKHHKKKVEAKFKTFNERNKKDPILITKKELFKDGIGRKKHIVDVVSRGCCNVTLSFPSVI